MADLPLNLPAPKQKTLDDAKLTDAQLDTLGYLWEQWVMKQDGRFMVEVHENERVEAVKDLLSALRDQSIIGIVLQVPSTMPYAFSLPLFDLKTMQVTKGVDEDELAAARPPEETKKSWGDIRREQQKQERAAVVQGRQEIAEGKQRMVLREKMLGDSNVKLGGLQQWRGGRG